MSSSHTSTNNSDETTVDASTYSEFISNILDSRDERMSRRDTWELSASANELDIHGDELDDAIDIARGIEDANQLRANLGVGSAVPVSSILQSLAAIGPPEQSVDEQNMSFNQAGDGDSEETKTISESTSCETLPNTADHQTAWLPSENGINNTSWLADLPNEDYVGGRTCVCYKCHHLFLDPDYDLFSGIDGNYDFWGLCRSCAHQLHDALRDTVVGDARADDSDNESFVTANEYDSKSDSVAKEKAKESSGSLAGNVNDAMVDFQGSDGILDYRFKGIAGFSHNISGSEVDLTIRKRGGLWRPASEPSMPTISLVNPEGTAALLWAEGKALSEPTPGKTLSEEP